jgi:hypothetical protein
VGVRAGYSIVRNGTVIGVEVAYAGFVEFAPFEFFPELVLNARVGRLINERLLISAIGGVIWPIGVPFLVYKAGVEIEYVVRNGLTFVASVQPYICYGGNIGIVVEAGVNWRPGN